MIHDDAKHDIPTMINVVKESRGTSFAWCWGEAWGTTLGIQCTQNSTPKGNTIAFVLKRKKLLI